MPSSIQGRQTDTLFEIKIVADYTMKAGNHKTFQKYERKKTKPESRQGCHWRVQGLEPPFFWPINAFEWEHIVGTLPLLWVGTPPPPFSNGWIRPWICSEGINNTLDFPIVYFNLFAFYPPFPITIPDFSNGHYFPVCLITVTGLFDYQICMYLKLVHCTTDWVSIVIYIKDLTFIHTYITQTI